MCIPLTHLDTTHVPPHSKAQEKGREGQEKVEEVTFISLIATQIQPISSKMSKYICQVETLLKPVRFHFGNFLKDPQAQHPPFSLPSLDHHPYSISLYLGPEAPLAEHQAFAPSLPMPFSFKFMLVRVLLTFNASARACGQSDRWQAGRLTT